MREPDKSRKSTWWRVRSRLGRDLVRDEDGGVLIYMTILIPVMMGVIGLAVDASRLFILNTEQKDLADAAALAGAYELDGGYVSVDDNAIVRATNAARNVVTNDPRWASDAEPESQIVSIRFCEELTGPSHLRECDGYTTDSRDAYHIEVITEARRVFPSFLVAVGAVSEPQSSAIVIAGSSIVACNVQPLMICNPFEAEGKEFDPDPGQMLIFRPKAKDPKEKDFGEGGNDQLAPGNFTLVDPPGQTSSSAGDTRDLLSKQGYDFCFANEVNPRTGVVFNKVVDGINVRFDYPVKCNDANCDADLTAAPHVIKAAAPETAECKKFDAIPGSKLYPEDDMAGRITKGPMTIGTGVISELDASGVNKLDDYWATHHGGTWPTHADGSHFTRYEAYIAEIAMASTDWTGIEEPAPQCLAEASSGPARRTIAASIVNCLEWNVRGNSVNEIRADKYAEFFIFKPAMENPPDGAGKKDSSIYTEFVRMMTPDDADSKLKRIVQLYR